MNWIIFNSESTYNQKKKRNNKIKKEQEVVAHDINLSTQETEADLSLWVRDQFAL